MRLGLNEQDIDMVFKVIDRSGDGSISIDEFIRAARL